MDDRLTIRLPECDESNRAYTVTHFGIEAYRQLFHHRISKGRFVALLIIDDPKAREAQLLVMQGKIGGMILSRRTSDP